LSVASAALSDGYGGFPEDVCFAEQRGLVPREEFEMIALTTTEDVVLRAFTGTVLCFLVLGFACVCTPISAENVAQEGDEILAGYAILQRDGDRIISLPVGCTPEEIRGFLFQVVEQGLPFHGEDGAQLFADACGKAAVPTLLDLLESKAPHTVKLNALLCLGKIGASDSTPHIVKYIETPKELPWKEAYDLMTLGMAALAFIGDDSALDYIERMMTEEYWEKRAATPAYAQEQWLPEEIAKKQIRKYTVDILSFSGRARARKRLLELQAHPESPWDAASVQGALKHWQARATLRQKREGRGPSAE
jgi:hypothetical protein